MNAARPLPRRTWLGWCLAAASPWAGARKPEPVHAEDAADTPPPTASAAANATNAAKPKSGTNLTVKVTGSDGKQVAMAKVEFEFASGVSLDRRTNAEGIAQIQPPSEGEATVRVIAVGWSSAQRDIVVKRGKPIELAIQLRR